MRPALVRRDDRGLFLRTGGFVFRTGAVNVYGHSYRMDDGGLKEGDRVPAQHQDGSPLARLRLADGKILYWTEDDHHQAYGLIPVPDDITWNDDGTRHVPVSADRQSTSAPRQIEALTGAGIDKILSPASRMA